MKKRHDRLFRLQDRTSDKEPAGADIGLNAMTEGLSGACTLSFSKIRILFIDFRILRPSTAGIPQILISLNGLLQPVCSMKRYQAGREDLGRRNRLLVENQLWWLWIFSNERSPCYCPDKARARAVAK